jgi:alpha-ketoglutarate-dependent taurine dioxygenase
MSKSSSSWRARVMRNDTIGAYPLSGAGGAEIREIDLSRPLEDEDHETIRPALAKRGFLSFRDWSRALIF